AENPARVDGSRMGTITGRPRHTWLDRPTSMDRGPCKHRRRRSMRVRHDSSRASLASVWQEPRSQPCGLLDGRSHPASAPLRDADVRSVGCKALVASGNSSRLSTDAVVNVLPDL